MVLMSLVNSPIGRYPSSLELTARRSLNARRDVRVFLSIDNRPRARLFLGTAEAARPYASIGIAMLRDCHVACEGRTRRNKLPSRGGRPGRIHAMLRRRDSYRQAKALF